MHITCIMLTLLLPYLLTRNSMINFVAREEYARLRRRPDYNFDVAWPSSTRPERDPSDDCCHPQRRRSRPRAGGKGSDARSAIESIPAMRACRWIAGLCRRFILAADISIRAVATAAAAEIGGCEPKSTRGAVVLFLFNLLAVLRSSPPPSSNPSGPLPFHHILPPVKLDAPPHSSDEEFRLSWRRGSRKRHPAGMSPTSRRADGEARVD